MVEAYEAVYVEDSSLNLCLSEDVRHRIGDTPSNSNMSEETADPFRRTGSSGPVSVIALFE